MAAAAPDPKLIEYSNVLGDYTRLVSEMELRRILKALEAIIARVHDHRVAGIIYHLKALCYLRLGQPTKALDECRLALQRLPEPTQERADTLGNQAVALGQLGRYEEAANSSIEAARIPHGYTHGNLGNLAEFLHRLGDTDAALNAFEEALGLADLANPAHCATMANQAAELGLDQEALELFARFLTRKSGTEFGDKSAIDVIRAADEDDKAWLKSAPALDAAIRRGTAMVDELGRASSQKDDQGDDATSAEALDVYEATRRLREAALARGLSS